MYLRDVSYHLSNSTSGSSSKLRVVTVVKVGLSMAEMSSGTLRIVQDCSMVPSVTNCCRNTVVQSLRLIKLKLARSSGLGPKTGPGIFQLGQGCKGAAVNLDLKKFKHIM